MEDAGLFVKEIFVDGGAQIKRLRTAPQGRGYRIRKRSNHVTIILGSRVAPAAISPKPQAESVQQTEETEVTAAKKTAATKKPSTAVKKTTVAKKNAAKPITKAATAMKTTRTKRGA
jgi:large subunit ribosomal protein L22